MYTIIRILFNVVVYRTDVTNVFTF